MSVTIITHLHASPGKDKVLVGLLSEGRDRMRAAEGCEFFDLIQDVQDPCSFVFQQRWASEQDHETAFNERIVKTGHIQSVMSAVDVPIDQHSYQVVS